MKNIIWNYLIGKCKNDNKIVLSNIDLENISKVITNEEINISSDKLLTCGGIDNLNKYNIFNLDWNTRTHWVAMYVDNTSKLVNFFDSFGNSLSEKFIIPKSYIVT